MVQLHKQRLREAQQGRQNRRIRPLLWRRSTRKSYGSSRCVFSSHSLASRVDDRAQHQLLTSMADLQNLQKRKEADVKQAKEFAISKFANDVVSDLDVLTLALTSVPAEARTSDGPIKALFEGVSLTASTLERTLKRHGVISFDPTGDVFDPNVHEATFIVPVRLLPPCYRLCELTRTQMPGKKPNTIFDCQKKGWKIGTRILRAPQVGVVAEQPK